MTYSKNFFILRSHSYFSLFSVFSFLLAKSSFQPSVGRNEAKQRLAERGQLLSSSTLFFFCRNFFDSSPNCRVIIVGRERGEGRGQGESTNASHSRIRFTYCWCRNRRHIASPSKSDHHHYDDDNIMETSRKETGTMPQCPSPAEQKSERMLRGSK